MSDAHESHHGNYWKIWAWLCALLVVSVAGPFLEIFWVTMVTAFGIACVKAYMVARNGGPDLGRPRARVRTRSRLGDPDLREDHHKSGGLELGRGCE